MHKSYILCGRKNTIIRCLAPVEEVPQASWLEEVPNNLVVGALGKGAESCKSLFVKGGWNSYFPISSKKI